MDYLIIYLKQDFITVFCVLAVAFVNNPFEKLT